MVVLKNCFFWQYEYSVTVYVTVSHKTTLTAVKFKKCCLFFFFTVLLLVVGIVVILSRIALF